jgi:hypothetical protein
MILQIYTVIHVLISLIGILTGLVVLFGMFAGHRLDGWAKWFVITTVLTSVTGFFFPFHGFTPAIGVGIISLIVLSIAIIARYSRHLAGRWRWLYVVTAMIALYLNAFVLLVVFRKNTGTASIGTDANRATIQTHATHCFAAFGRARTRCRHSIPA